MGVLHVPSYANVFWVYTISPVCLVTQGSPTAATADGVSGATMHAQSLECGKPVEQLWKPGCAG